jgi:hypothetical protein
MSTEIVTETIHFTVNKEHLTTTEKVLTGAQIKALAKVDPTDLLELREADKKVPITDNQPVTMKDGMHFRAYPGGKDS